MGKFDSKPKAYAVTFILHDNQKPIANARLHVEAQTSYDVTTNANGMAVISAFDPSIHTFDLIIEAPDYKKVIVTKLYAAKWNNVFTVNLQQEIPVTPPVEEPKPWQKISNDALIKFKGNFCGMVIPDLPLHRHNVCYTPAYLCYDQEWRSRIRKEYKLRGYTHMPVHIHNGLVYGNHYPELNLSDSDVRDALIELWNDGIIPVVTTMADEDIIVSPRFHAVADLIRIAFVKWEMNEPDGNDTYRMAHHIVESVEAVRPDCLLFVHFSPKHGAGIGPDNLYFCPTDGELFAGPGYCGKHNVDIDISNPNEANANGKWWHWAKAVGVDGILMECDADENPQQSAEFIEDFTERFGLGINGWPTGLLKIGFEIRAARAWDGTIGTEQEQIDYCDYLRRYPYKGVAPEGWCNG
jgi:hypothetical protein